MAALTAARNTVSRSGVDFELPQAGGTICYAGAIVAMRADGYAAPGATSATARGVGVCQATSDATGLADGALSVKVSRGVFCFANSVGADLITRAAIGQDCYIVDDQTVALTSATNTRSVAGTIRDVDADGVWVEF